MAKSRDQLVAWIVNEMLSQTYCVTSLMQCCFEPHIVWPAKMLAQEIINDPAGL